MFPVRIGAENAVRTLRMLNEKKADRLHRGHEDTIPNVAPGTMPKIVAESSNFHTADVTIGDSELGLILLKVGRQASSEVRDSYQIVRPVQKSGWLTDPKSAQNECAERSATHKTTFRAA